MYLKSVIQSFGDFAVQMEWNGLSRQFDICSSVFRKESLLSTLQYLFLATLGKTDFYTRLSYVIFADNRDILIKSGSWICILLGLQVILSHVPSIVYQRGTFLMTLKSFRFRMNLTSNLRSEGFFFLSLCCYES